MIKTTERKMAKTIRNKTTKKSCVPSFRLTASDACPPPMGLPQYEAITTLKNSIQKLKDLVNQTEVKNEHF